jgi:hypothetical protein
MSLLVHTAEGRVRAKTAVVCGNTYVGNAVPGLTNKIMPVSSQVLTTAPLDPKLLDALLPLNYFVEDCNSILDYYRSATDNHLLFGGGVVHGGTGPVSIEGKIRPHLERTFPALRGTKIDFTWSGIFALTVTRVPHAGRLSQNVLLHHGDSSRRRIRPGGCWGRRCAAGWNVLTPSQVFPICFFWLDGLSACRSLSLVPGGTGCPTSWVSRIRCFAKITGTLLFERRSKNF